MPAAEAVVYMTDRATPAIIPCDNIHVSESGALHIVQFARDVDDEIIMVGEAPVTESVKIYGSGVWQHVTSRSINED